MIELKRDNFLKALTFPNKRELLAYLRKFSQRKDLFIVGGAVRDFLLNRPIYDLDIVVKEDLKELVFFLASALSYTVVPLSEEFGIYRLAKDKYTIDFTLYRGDTLIEDLKERDFTINAMAIPVKALFEDSFEIYDPWGGLEDLKNKKIRAIDEKNILSDPLRILRGYRFLAYGFGELEVNTRTFFKKHKTLLSSIAPERINMELRYLLLTNRASVAINRMVEDEVFDELFPEFKVCKGLPQPSFHHLDVFMHSLEAFTQAEKILMSPTEYLDIPSVPKEVFEEDFIISVKLASLFHDVGKGYTYNFGEERITFYGHEKVSSNLWEERAKSLRFKREIIERVSKLVKNHMRPCHLLKEWEEGRLTLRAKRHLVKDCPNLYELWIVALADSLASKGEDKELDYEEKLNNFFKELCTFKEEMEKIEKRERLITGKDLINLGFIPGPHFKSILEEIEVKTLEGEIKSKAEALDYVIKNYSKYLQKNSYASS